MENTKKRVGYGTRGWVLIIWVATAFLSYLVIGNYPLNILSDFYGGQQLLSTVYTVASIIGIVIQIIVSPMIGKMKSIKKFGVVMGIIAIILLICIMRFPAGAFWIFCYGAGTVVTTFYGTFALSILVGQWFPTKKGSVMGITTMAFPIGNGLLGGFSGLVFSDGMPNPTKGFLPFLIVFIIGLVIGIAFVPDYPEEAGAFRDNNPNMTPERAKEMMLAEIEDKKTSVWKLNHTLTTRDFWFLTVPAGFLLSSSVGIMTQSNAITAAAGLDDKFAILMVLIMIFGLIGSFILGVLDDKLGTKKAMIIACILMLAAGILGVASKSNGSLILPTFIVLSLYMGASSNFTVSFAAQYWRREDFSTVFGSVNPIANLINAAGPMVVGMLMGMTGSYVSIFALVVVLGVIGTVLCLLFNAGHVKEKDDKYRIAAGKVLDDALANRK